MGGVGYCLVVVAGFGKIGAAAVLRSSFFVLRCLSGLCGWQLAVGSWQLAVGSGSGFKDQLPETPNLSPNLKWAGDWNTGIRAIAAIGGG